MVMKRKNKCLQVGEPENYILSIWIQMYITVALIIIEMYVYHAWANGIIRPTTYGYIYYKFYTSG